MTTHSTSRTSLTSLPIELIILILRDLDNIRWLLPVLLSGKLWYDAFLQDRSIPERIIRNQIPSILLPFAIAVDDAARNATEDLTAESLLDTLYNSSSALAQRVRNIKLHDARQLGQMHDLVDHFIHEYSCSASSRLLLHCPELDQNLSTSEYHRFSIAFYRAELFFRLSRTTSDSSAYSMNNWNIRFFDAHAPWENEQLACVHGFLEQRLCDAGFNEFAHHDVCMGEICVDYFARGLATYLIQVSQGLRFLYTLEEATNYTEKRVLLRRAFDLPGSSLAWALLVSNEFYIDGVLESYRRRLIKLKTRPTESGDHLDNGPFQTWLWAHSNAPDHQIIAMEITECLRWRAYVMWDQKRVTTFDLLPIFERALQSGEASYIPSDDEHIEMLKSIDERFKIRQRGGTGYWSAGDESKIKWNN